MVSGQLSLGHIPPVSWVRVGVPRGGVYDRMYVTEGKCPEPLKRGVAAVSLGPL